MTDELVDVKLNANPGQIEFKPNENDWAIRIRKDGIFFNREFYNESTVDDFALAFMELLEKGFDVTFTKREATNSVEIGKESVDGDI
ncbi:MAG: hypothetical protein KAS32_31640 [Candidatus Peribacteraceae bacterium]|nr:hypothetical protein [Candidatus Peribacteraceae bacterium]